MIDFFILCSPRSGSTFLRLNLDKLNEVVTLPETHFFGFYDKFKSLRIDRKDERLKILNKWINWYKVKRLKLDRDYLMRDLLESVSTWRDILDLTIKFYLDDRKINSNNSLICEKSSNHILHQSPINKFYPGAKAIYLVRDPRAIVASLKTCTWSTSNVVTNAKVWRNGIREIGKIKPNLVIQYEKLIEEPVQTLEDICSFLDISREKNIFEIETSNEIEAESSTSINSLKPPSKEHIDKWKNMLSRTDRDIEIIETICKKEMLQYDYQMMGSTYDFRFYSTLITQSAASYLAKFG